MSLVTANGSVVLLRQADTRVLLHSWSAEEDVDFRPAMFLFSFWFRACSQSWQDPDDDSDDDPDIIHIVTSSCSSLAQPKKDFQPRQNRNLVEDHHPPQAHARKRTFLLCRILCGMPTSAQLPLCHSHVAAEAPTRFVFYWTVQ